MNTYRLPLVSTTILYILINKAGTVITHLLLSRKPALLLQDTPFAAFGLHMYPGTPHADRLMLLAKPASGFGRAHMAAFVGAVVLLLALLGGRHVLNCACIGADFDCIVEMIFC